MNDPTQVESIIDPAQPIVDSHHHLWCATSATAPNLTDYSSGDCIAALARIYQKQPRYLFDDLLSDIGSGHNVRATVFVQAHSMYRRTGPEAMRSVGEVEFANGMAAMSASGVFGESLVCAGIIGGVDLRMGSAVVEVLRAHIAAGGGRYRGIRSLGVAYDKALPDLNGALGSSPGVHADPAFRDGFRQLEPLGLSYDAFLLEPQLPELLDLARSFPATQIVLNHVGMPTKLGPYSDPRNERFECWRNGVSDLAGCDNVVVKLGGLGNPMCGLPSSSAASPPNSLQLATEWRPYIEHCIEAFGVSRCMFESNAPVDKATAPYPIIWNALKRIASGASNDEKNSLFFDTASRVYRLGLSARLHQAVPDTTQQM
jgi:L-fuconolactonase